jgi:Bacterial capsule synthesis protein PGA_cap
MPTRLPARRLAAIAIPLCLLSAAALALLVARVPPSSAASQFKLPSLSLKLRASFTLVAGGDVALAGDPNESTFTAVHGFLRGADLAIANLEGTLATAGSARCLAGSDAASGCFTFRASPAWALVLKQAGLTALNVANNHALDYGAEGQHETLAALQSEQLAYQGLPGRITYLHEGAVRVALIGCAPYSWAQDLRDVAGTRALVRRAARRAQVVIVYMHAGAEGADAAHVANRDETYLGERRGNPVAFAHAMIDAGADLVLASGPHVLRAMEWYRKRLIAYSLGNLAGSHTLSTAGVLAESALLRVTLDARGRFIEGSLIPLKLDGFGTPAIDPRRASLGLVRSLSRQDFPRSAVRISPSGTLARR